MIERISNRFSLSRSVATLVAWSGVILAVGVVFSLVILVSTYIAGDFLEKPFCLANECVSYTLKQFSQVVVVFWGGVQLLVAFATIGGIYLALTNYLEVSKTNALATHLAQFSNFQSYVSLQIARCDQLAMSSFDIMAWYNSMFPSSRQGNLSVSIAYSQIIQQLADQINYSNAAILGGLSKKFSYAEHQKSVISILNEFGITIERYHRKQWSEIEDEVFTLISIVNKTFCLSAQVALLPARRYL